MNSFNNNNSNVDIRNSMPTGRVTEVRREWLVRTDEALAQRLQDEEITTHLCGNRHRNTQIREDFPTALSQQKQLEQQAKHHQMMLESQAQADALIARKVASRLDVAQKRKVKQQMRIESEDFSLALKLQSRSRPPSYQEFENDNGCNQPHYFEEIDDVNLAVQADAIGLPVPEDQLQDSASSCSWQQPSTRSQYFAPISGLDGSLDEDLDITALGMSKEEVKQIKERLLQEERDAELARKISSSDDKGADALLLADMRCAVEAQDGELARLLQERENQRARRAKERAKQKALARRQQRAAAALSDGDLIQPNIADEYSDPRDLLSGGFEKQCSLSKSMESDINYIEPYENEKIETKANAMISKESSKEWMAHLAHVKRSVPSSNNNPGFATSSYSHVPYATDSSSKACEVTSSNHPINIAKMIDPTYENTQEATHGSFYGAESPEELHNINIVPGNWRSGQSSTSSSNPPKSNGKQTKGKGKKIKKNEKHSGCRTQ